MAAAQPRMKSPSWAHARHLLTMGTWAKHLTLLPRCPHLQNGQANGSDLKGISGSRATTQRALAHVTIRIIIILYSKAYNRTNRGHGLHLSCSPFPFPQVL